MIAACPRCSARYRIDSGKLRAEGVRMRCSRCEAVFRVRPPVGESAQPAAPAAAPVAAPVSAQPAAPVAAPAQQTAQRAPRPPDTPLPADRARLVLLADPIVDEGKALANTLASWGLSPVLVHDGVEAILTIQRLLPAVIVVDAALPKMFGFQVCELVKRNESLRHIHVVLVGAIHNRDRYRRPPTELYGADAYVERHQLPEALRAIFTDFGIELPGVARVPPVREVAPPPPDASRVEVPPARVRETAPVGVPAEPLRPPPPPAAPAAVPTRLAAPPRPVPSVPSVPPVPSAGGPASQVSDAEIANAERLARIVISDIILYNEEKFDAAVRSGNAPAAMTSELAEGRSLFAARVESRVREQRDFLVEELLRAVAARSRR